ncbi:hypothetical protein BS17DRAFT_786375 [Gyrodon lividus]|nr:hypothetical protein BS17DRAFT_786375 [Gyrodon lividus]
MVVIVCHIFLNPQNSARLWSGWSYTYGHALPIQRRLTSNLLYSASLVSAPENATSYNKLAETFILMEADHSIP